MAFERPSYIGKILDLGTMKLFCMKFSQMAKSFWIILQKSFLFTFKFSNFKVTIELSVKYVLKRKLRANFMKIGVSNLAPHKEQKEFGSSFLTSLKQGLTRKTHGKSKVRPSLSWFPPSSPT
jgi:hypothetical protein